MIYVRCQHTSEHLMSSETVAEQKANDARPRWQFHRPGVDVRVCLECLALALR